MEETRTNGRSAGSGIRDASAEISLGRPGSGLAPGVVTTECSACGKRRVLGAESPGRGGGPPNGLGPQIALESVHVIDTREAALVEGLRVAPWECGKGVAGLLLVKRQHPGSRWHSSPGTTSRASGS